MYMYNYMYMGKNYTLYIKYDRFSDEPNKSGLVNDLLLKHYGGTTPPLAKNEQVLEDGSRAIVIPFKKSRLATPTPEKLKQVAESKGVKFCPNGHAIPEGRSRCMGKGCKYA